MLPVLESRGDLQLTHFIKTKTSKFPIWRMYLFSQWSIKIRKKVIFCCFFPFYSCHFFLIFWEKKMSLNILPTKVFEYFDGHLSAARVATLHSVCIALCIRFYGGYIRRHNEKKNMWPFKMWIGQSSYLYVKIRRTFTIEENSMEAPMFLDKIILTILKIEL